MNNSFIDISVIVPVYNAASTICKCLDSLCKQCMSNIEIICVDDGSIDESWGILERYTQLDHRIRIYKKSNGGVSTARNYALDRASGKYVMFLDADDWYEPDACEKAYSLISKNQSDVGLFCVIMEYANRAIYRSILNQNEAHFDGEQCKSIHRQCIGLIGEECKRIKEIDYLSVVYLKIYRREIIEKFGIRFYDIREIGSFEDGLFNIQYLEHVSKLSYSPEAFYHYRKTNSSSITSCYREHLEQQWIRLFMILSDYVNDLNDVSYKKALNNRMAYAILGLGLNVMGADFSLRLKYKRITNLLQIDELKCVFSHRELMYMPISFRIIFECAKLRWNAAVYILLLIMHYIISKNKGMKA